MNLQFVFFSSFFLKDPVRMETGVQRKRTVYFSNAVSVLLEILHWNLVWDFVLLILRITAQKKYSTATVLGN